MKSHAKLSASASHRWLQCTPSAFIEATLPDTTSPYAEEGTLAHELAEAVLARELGLKTNEECSKLTQKIKRSEHWNDEMLTYISDFTDQVKTFIQERDFVDLEQRVEFSDIVPGGFGTADVVIIKDGELHIVDLKYGKGVAVDAFENSQLMLYAWGAVQKYKVLYDFETVSMTIIQPRLETISTYTISLEDLTSWATGYVMVRAALAAEGKGEFAPGDETCRFCKAKARCRARSERATELAKKEFADPTLLKENEIAKLLPLLSEIVKWAKDVQDYALEQARDHGVSYSGYKLVAGRSNRRIEDSSTAMTLLKKKGYKVKEYTKPKELLGITELEKLVGGKKAFTELLGDVVIKPEGKPTLVPESDKRPALNNVLEDFS